jgi:septum site-determining protein MinC
MSEDIVKIKGTSLGLQLSFAPEASFEAVRENLKAKLESGTTFFLRGTLVLIPRDAFMGSERDELQRLFHDYGLICRTQKPESKPEEKREMQPAAQPEPVQPSSQPEELKPQEMVVINRTLRGGQEIRTKSSVLVCGNVNPGAQIIAGEDATGRIDWLTSAIIEGVTAEDFAYRSENAYCPPTSMVRDVVLMAVDDLCNKF